MTQQIEPSLWKEFEEEQSKIINFDVSKLQLSPEDNKTLDVFFKKFLDPSEIFPEGSRHAVIEKNFAIYIVKNNIPIEQIKEAYKSKKFNFNSLLSQIKGVMNGTYQIPNVSIGELVNWCKNNRPDLISLFKTESYSEKIYNSQFIEKEIKTIQNELKILSDKELSTYECPTVEWTIDNLIRTGSTNVLAGKRSTLKSWIALSMCNCVSTGKTFLDTFKCSKGAVLFLDRENFFPELKKRQRMVKIGLGIQEDVDIYFISESYLKIDNIIDLKRLESIIKEKKITLLVIDVYRRVIGFDENDAREVSKLFVDMLKPLTERTNVSILLLHHEKKGESSGDDMDMLRGSSDLANYVDSIIQLDRKGNNLIFKQNKNRASKEVEPFQITIETDEVEYFRFKYKGKVESASLYIAKAIVEWIIKNQVNEFTYSELLAYCTKYLNYSKSNTINALKELQNQGIVTKGNSFKSPYIVSKELNLEFYNG